jgi:phosphoserine aminotransferase
MAGRKHNFNPGPAALPLTVLEKAQRNLVDHEGLGLSLLEMSHRAKDFEAILEKATATISELYGLPADHDVLFLQGGASLQFAMVPLNLGPGGAYVNTGEWSTRAVKEAQIVGRGTEVWSSEKEAFRSVPQPGEKIAIPADAPYVHITTNNTIYGTQWHHTPDYGKPLVADMSSDFLSRPVDFAKVDLAYAGAQKNAGPAGVTLVIGKKSLLHEFRGAPTVPTVLRYATHGKAKSLYHTPPTFAIYVVGLVAEWVKGQGGLAAMHERNLEKARAVYAAIDERPELYRGHAEVHSRSLMNVTFRLASEAQETAFLAQAKERGLIGLKGHRSVGGLRASLYNAVPMASVEALVDLMRSFEAKA